MATLFRWKYVFAMICLGALPGSAIAQGSGNSIVGSGAVHLDCGPSITDLNFPYTAEVWVKFAASPPRPHPIWSSGQQSLGFYFGAWLLVDFNGRVIIAYGDGTGAGSTDRRSSVSDVSIPFGEWVHICAIQVGPLSSRMYINGLEVPVSYNGTGSTAIVHDPAGRQVIGWQLSYEPGVYMNGEIDELRIWRTARTEEEIRANMCRKLSGSEPGLEAYWRFDEGAGSTAFDASPSAHHGNFAGAMTWRISGAPLGDASVFRYPSSWLGETLGIDGPDGQRFGAADVMTSASEGLHVYRVDAMPNETTGLPSGAAAPYYGVFATESGASYSALAQLTDSACALCNLAWASRNDNAAGAWLALDGIPSENGCALSRASESSIDETRRAEYALAGPVSFDPCPEDSTQPEPTDPCVLALPNAFSPNGDGVNDQFGLPLSIACPDLPLFELMIYNRWGQNIWATDNPGIRWDGTYQGKQQELGVYVWSLLYQQSTEEQPQRRTGTVSLIR
jgi:gliding motility-associated-like protein